MKTRHKIFLSLALVHLVLVVCGAAGTRPISVKNPIGDGVALYSSLSGADNGYGFFAPGVGAQFATTFVLTDRQGRQWRDTLDLGLTPEANLRFTGISNLLPTLEPRQLDLVLLSLAGTMFGQHPAAETVTVQVEMFGVRRGGGGSDFPTMREYCGGARPRWLPMLEVTFSRTDVKQTEVEYAEAAM